ncbi:MAG: NAD kinase [Bacteroidetes bacterium]|nr:NAD kinase [Bacteroidota bacterium]MBS1741166.1 NAD kinase [Bacteroidota bacterium]MBS1776055.1 NAD kinase [Bacteroidota bacterium]
MIVAIYNRAFDVENIPLIQHVLQKLHDNQLQLVFFHDFYERFAPHIPFEYTPKLFTSRRDLPLNTDMLFSLGGDGTLLDTVTYVGSTNIPIIGVNLGRLGFLAAIPEEEIENAIISLVRGSYTIDKRTLIHLDSSIPLFDGSPFALNEFTLHRKDSSSMIKIHTYLNGEFLNTYWADGLIVATPTGSTGYSLSCGGPVVFPQTSSFVITPVAPHNLNTRSIVVPDDNVISFEVEGRAEQFLCTMDARTESIPNSVQLAVKKEIFTISLVRPDEHNFLNTIRQKLYWGIDRRN